MCKVIALQLLACFSLAGSALAAGPIEPAQTPKPRVDVVFVLDTTGSMGGLIQGAKQKIWSIVNEIAKGRPSPEIRLGLVAYRDRGDAYVTQRTELTTDLDAVYERLTALGADGGGDGPESVNQALWEAVHQMAWTPERSALKVIFLVGDAPPHMDYPDDPKYPATCQEAMKKDLIIHTIQCGGHLGTTRYWKEIATLAEGRYMAIAQSGGTLAVVTPYDGRLAELAAALDATYVGYGSAGERKESAKKMESARAIAAEAAPEAAASRASYKATSGSMAAKDLLADTAEGRVKLEALKPEELPAEMQKMSPAQRKAFLEKKKAARAKVQAEIKELAKQRDAYVQEQLRVAGKSGDSFDAKVIESLRAKAGEKGIQY